LLLKTEDNASIGKGARLPRPPEFHCLNTNSHPLWPRRI
jgi:hypothetical protein